MQIIDLSQEIFHRAPVLSASPAIQVFRFITHYENLAHLDRLVGKGRFRFIAFPLKIRRGAGSPVRAVAVFDEEPISA